MSGVQPGECRREPAITPRRLIVNFPALLYSLRRRILRGESGMDRYEHRVSEIITGRKRVRREEGGEGGGEGELLTVL